MSPGILTPTLTDADKRAEGRACCVPALAIVIHCPYFDTQAQALPTHLQEKRHRYPEAENTETQALDTDVQTYTEGKGLSDN